MKWHRVQAVVRRHAYEARRNITRLTEAFYWPLLDVLVWGFFTIYLGEQGSTGSKVVGFLLGAVILWNLFYSFQRDIAVGFLDEMWSRNLVNIFASPLSVWEYLAGLTATTTLKIAINMAVAGSLALAAYHFNIFTYGVELLPHLLNILLFSFAIGVFTAALILRYSTKIEILAWSFASLLQPVAAVYYPMSVLPPALQAIARLLPVAHAFEGMREVLAGEGFLTGHFWPALFLNLAYLAGAMFVFRVMFASARRRGVLVKME